MCHYVHQVLADLVCLLFDAGQVVYSGFKDFFFFFQDKAACCCYWKVGYEGRHTEPTIKCMSCLCRAERNLIILSGATTFTCTHPDPGLLL